jgi:hypothetical protein
MPEHMTRTMRTLGGYCRREVPARSAPAYEHQLQQKATMIGSNCSSLMLQASYGTRAASTTAAIWSSR